MEESNFFLSDMSETIKGTTVTEVDAVQDIGVARRTISQVPSSYLDSGSNLGIRG